MTKPIVVLDTSVLFSYVHNPSRRYAVLDAVHDGDLTAVACSSTLAELRDVSLRFFEADRLDSFLKHFLPAVTLVPEPQVRFNLYDDPKDSIFFNLAIETGASYLVSFDKGHILAVNNPHHPQHDELRKLSRGLRVFHPIEMARELGTLRILKPEDFNRDN